MGRKKRITLKTQATEKFLPDDTWKKGSLFVSKINQLGLSQEHRVPGGRWKKASDLSEVEL